MIQQRLLREPAAREYLGRAAYYDLRDLDELVEKLREGEYAA